MPQTKADRQEAAQKAAATRQSKDARKSLDQARRAAGDAADNIGQAARSLGDAAVNVGKSVASRAKVLSR